MKKKNLLPKLNGLSTMYLSVALGMLLLIPAMLYGHPDLNNPFYVASCGLVAQVFLRGLTGDFRGKKYGESKKALMLGPVNIITGLLIVFFALPKEPILGLAVGLMVGIFLDFGLRDSLFAVSYLLERRKDGKEFREEMKRVAEQARMEKALADDLAEFLVEFGPADNPESSEN